MPTRAIWDVEPRGDRWAVQHEGGKRAHRLFDHQEDAIERGVALAKRTHGQLRIKAADGTIRDERTYTRDPYPPKG